MSKLVVWSSTFLAEVAVFADYLERHGCQVISVSPSYNSNLIRVYARAPEDFDNIKERAQASDISFRIAPGNRLRATDPDTGVEADILIDACLELARRGDS